MRTEITSSVERWLTEGIIDAPTADRIRVFETQQARTKGLNVPAVIALAFGAVMLGAGVLLFVAAHWDELSPVSRFSVVLALVALFHVIGAAASEKFPALSITMHTLGTVATGAGIFLTGQIFNLQEHWPGGVLLWAIAALIGWALLRHWTQAALCALLFPAWLQSEWMDAIKWYRGGLRPGFIFDLLLALVMFTGLRAREHSPLQRALLWIGGISLLPSYVCASYFSDPGYSYRQQPSVPSGLSLVGWSVAFAAPLALAWLLRGKDSWPLLIAAVWAVGVTYLTFEQADTGTLMKYALHAFGAFVWGVSGAAALIFWGYRERIKPWINMGMVLFAVVILSYYFSNLMDKLGRSTSLIGFGVLFLVISYFTEKGRKRLIANMNREVLL